MANPFKAVWNGIKYIAIHVKSGFVAIFGQKAAEDFGHASLEMLKSALGQIAVAEVGALAGVHDLSGVQKAAQAQAAILEKAKVAGISTSKSIVNLLVELAVQFLKKNLEALPVA